MGTPTPLCMLRFAACCFLLFVATLNAKAQQAAGPSVSAGSSYVYSSRGIGFKQGNAGFDVFQIQGGDQIGVLKVGGGHIEFKKLGDVSPELEKTVMDAVHDYQMGRVSPATAPLPVVTAPANPIPSNSTGDQTSAGGNPCTVSNVFVDAAHHVTKIQVTGPSRIPGQPGQTVEFDAYMGGAGAGARQLLTIMSKDRNEQYGGKVTNYKGDVVNMFTVGPDGKPLGGKVQRSDMATKGQGINAAAVAPYMEAINQSQDPALTPEFKKRFHNAIVGYDK
jgi:hypothetical protein